MDMRNVYFVRCGGHPPDYERPTTDPLICLNAKLKAGKCPYADFAVFGPHGERYAKERKFTAQVWVMDALTEKQLHGPTSFGMWKRHWRVFRAAMIMCQAASPAALDAYARGVEELVTRYPNCWGLIFFSEETTRSERWARIKEEFDDVHSPDPPKAYRPEQPWDYIISHSSFGSREGLLDHWWDQHVKHPASLAPKDGFNFLQTIEGTAPEVIRQSNRNPKPEALTKASAPCAPEPASISRASPRLATEPGPSN